MRSTSFSPCPLCNSNNIALKFEKDQYEIVECNECSLQFASPFPTDEELKSFYQSHYFDQNSEHGYQVSQDEYIEHIENRAKTLAERIPDWLKSDLENFDGKFVLDAGCGDGAFLKTVDQNNNKSIGVDISEFTLKRCSQVDLKVARSLLEDLPFGGNQFDYVRMAAVLEHIKNPVGVIQEVHRVVKNGGYIEVETVNSRSLRVLWEGKNWWEYKPPEHLIFFSKEHVINLLERNGFEVITHYPAGNLHLTSQGESKNSTDGDNTETNQTNRKRIYNKAVNRLRSLTAPVKPLLKYFFGTHIQVFARKNKN